MGNLVENNHVKLLFYGSKHESSDPTITLKSDGIYMGENNFLKTENLPFKSKHFIQNTMAAVCACIALNIDPESIKMAVILI
jgi:UDP-N-acetylmuramoyl-L-alanyl-D-glutamate--2,6-diaminopimelate ligase